MRIRFAIAFLTLMVLTFAARGQDTRARSTLSDDQVRRILMLALDNISRLRCDNEQPCAPATAEQKANPPLTIAEARAIMQRGVLSGLGEYCGLDWDKQDFEPMMVHWRHDLKKNERQMALVAMLHGIMQGMTSKSAGKTACTEQQRQNVGRQLTFRP